MWSSPLYSVRCLENQTGYIRISQFTDVTPDQYEKAFSDLKDQGMEQLVVDHQRKSGRIF